MADEIIIELKGMAHDKGLLELQHRINGFYCAANVENMEFAKINIVATKSPTYLLGR